MIPHGGPVRSARLFLRLEPCVDIDFATLTPYERYKLMSSLIVPRPIALITTLGDDGTVHAARSRCSTCSEKIPRSRW